MRHEISKVLQNIRECSPTCYQKSEKVNQIQELTPNGKEQ